MLILILTSLAILNVEISAIPSPTTTLNDGCKMPLIGFGTLFPKKEFDIVTDVLLTAIKVGYRHIDTSEFYLVEEDVGEAIQNAISCDIVTRKDMFITSKFDKFDRSEEVIPAIWKSLKRLQLDYLDLYLIHITTNVFTGEDFDILGIWYEMEKAQKMGLVKSIGVSNFNSSHLNKILTYGNIRPAVNQIEVNPTFANLELVAYCQQEHITVVAYGSNGFTVARPFRNVSLPLQFNNTTLVEIAEKYCKTTNQVILRYLMERQLIPLVKSTNRTHIRDNFDIFDFKLTEDEVYEINEFNKNIKVYDYSLSEAEGLPKYFYNMGLKEFYDQQGVKY